MPYDFLSGIKKALVHIHAGAFIFDQLTPKAAVYPLPLFVKVLLWLSKYPAKVACIYKRSIHVVHTFI